MHATFTLKGQTFMCSESTIKHEFTFTPAISLFVTCDTAEEIDRLFEQLLMDGQVLMSLSPTPVSEKFGWVQDGFGVSWQLNLAKKLEENSLSVMMKEVKKMIADIKQVEKGYIARYERHLEHTMEQVWAMLTDNEQLENWFQELRIGHPRKGGFMKFNMPNGQFEELEIFEYTSLSVLEFDWFGDIVRFELHSEKNGCLLIFKETFTTITEQRVKDLAGWHVCLDVIKSLLDGKLIESREVEWGKWHSQYEQALMN